VEVYDTYCLINVDLPKYEHYTGEHDDKHFEHNKKKLRHYHDKEIKHHMKELEEHCKDAKNEEAVRHFMETVERKQEELGQADLIVMDAVKSKSKGKARASRSRVFVQESDEEN